MALASIYQTTTMAEYTSQNVPAFLYPFLTFLVVNRFLASTHHNVSPPANLCQNTRLSDVCVPIEKRVIFFVFFFDFGMLGQMCLDVLEFIKHVFEWIE